MQLMLVFMFSVREVINVLVVLCEVEEAEASEFVVGT